MLENMPDWMEKKDDIPPGWLYIGDNKERYLLGQPGRNNIITEYKTIEHVLSGATGEMK